MNIVKLPPLESQHDFPFEDVRKVNIGSLAVVMSSPELVDLTHVSAEQIRWLFCVGHPTLARLAQLRYDGDISIVAPLSYGISVYETLSTIIAAEGSEDHGQVTLMGGKLLALDEFEISEYFDRAFEQFRESMPRTNEVVREATAGKFGHVAEYALLGVALAWQFEHDVRMIE